ncbi:glycosyl transferase family 28 [Verrucosispora sp. ts21]|uniref:Glycosyl transferase family 28 n=1 Tax=Micromonospora maris TaxID=1003110 RepID=A0A9X0I9U9_9ACTN|nr:MULTISPECIES: glycosyltransferase [Micromonospora]KUJ49648.1 glycosyl transferase family 28 [Micromonospora maris]PMR60299.1 glycosyl transferase family 28 [Verrucosispora sp. ts21]
MPAPRDGNRVGRAQLLVAVGTDKHPFDRLVGWLREWYGEVADEVVLTVQHGHTRVEGLPDAVPFLGHAELQTAMAGADLVVCHGGPATILEARRHGHLPIVVPRDPSLGEHVDNHQQLFARRLGAAGLVALCETRQELRDALTAGLAEPGRFTVTVDADAAEAQRTAVRRVGMIVEELVAEAAQRRHRPWWRPWRGPGPNGRHKL